MTNKLTEKIAVLDYSMEILNTKPEERTEVDEDVFGKMVPVTLKRMNPYQQHVLLKKFTIFLKFKFLKKLRYGVIFF